jgi:hypothetical protein
LIGTGQFPTSPVGKLLLEDDESPLAKLFDVDGNQFLNNEDHHQTPPSCARRRLSANFDWIQTLEPANNKRATAPTYLKRARFSSGDEDDEDFLKSTPTSTNLHLAIVGETRLKITFINLGVPGAIPQKFGKSGSWIPHGLVATHEMYEQPWKVEVYHEQNYRDRPTLITWKVTNLVSESVIQMTETSKQAAVRAHSGRTICNRVLKKALDSRAEELEASLIFIDNPTRYANVMNHIKALRPKRCTVGLLFFGLLHDTVQREMESLFASKNNKFKEKRFIN